MIDLRLGDCINEMNCLTKHSIDLKRLFKPTVIGCSTTMVDSPTGSEREYGAFFLAAFL